MPTNEKLFENIRQLFPVANNCTYFQSAGMSPVPKPVLNKIMEGYNELAEYGDIHFLNDIEEQKVLFEKIASLCGSHAEDVAFSESNSMAMSLLALAIQKKHPGKNIVCMEEEFPSNSVPFEYQGIKMKYVQHTDHRYSIENIISTCDSNTIAVVTSHVQYCTGFRQDIEKLGAELKNRGIKFIVNTTQGFPFYRLDIKKMNIDVLTCSVHKWGFCGHIGTIFITSPEWRMEFPSPVAGWLSVDVSKSNDFIHTSKNTPFDVWSNALQYQFGSSNFKSKLALLSSLNFLEEQNMELLKNHISELRNYLLENLKKLPVNIISPHQIESEQSAIVSFSISSEKNIALAQFLEKNKIFVALRNGYIRVSVNIFNNKKDIDILTNAMQNFLK